MDMQGVKRAVVSFIRDEEGASAIEYVLIAAMVAVALVAFVTPIRTAVTAIFTDIKTALEGATTP
ncbi:Flp family type IVb pilin [Thiohalobacter thiocyanaticus]|uniref:Flp family type IVb pilin n=1 Tax=Thiohalobacter thiocyanaticus TaxID=585455 RepID=A0A426QI68_9GAMM|nr:Flp family type IVb pilin [Thiohalobacter thiocyanaticus]RRQ21440.1 Flp family type IVb pilin [Thiohalobacter thiocyanaticus]